MRPPRLRCPLFSSTYPPHLLCFYKCGSYQTSLHFANLSLETQPYMRFLSVGPEVCLQLPSDSTSQWTPLLFSYTFPTTWACSGLSPVRARPWRANKNKCRCLITSTLIWYEIQIYRDNYNIYYLSGLSPHILKLPSPAL